MIILFALIALVIGATIGGPLAGLMFALAVLGTGAFFVLRKRVIAQDRQLKSLAWEVDVLRKEREPAGQTGPDETGGEPHTPSDFGASEGCLSPKEAALGASQQSETGEQFQEQPFAQTPPPFFRAGPNVVSPLHENQPRRRVGSSPLHKAARVPGSGD